MKSNHDMFARIGNPWITERDRREGRVFETRIRSEPDLPPSRKLRLRNADGSFVEIDVKNGTRREPKLQPVEQGRKLAARKKGLSDRLVVNRAFARAKPVTVK